MALPDIIEIIPLDKPVQAQITVPGSKSITNRALILAALAKGETTLRGALWSEDTQVMVECLQKLGFKMKLEPDPDEYCNCTITVQGLGGKIPNGGTNEKPLELFVGNAGTAARFLSALVCLGNGVYKLHGVPRMHQRPQAALFEALRQLGYRIDSENDKLPAIIHGVGPHKGRCDVSIAESSQFASALLLCAEVGKWSVDIVGYNPEEAPYIQMTEKLLGAFPSEGGTFQIEPDASSGSYFWGAGWLFRSPNYSAADKSFEGIYRFETEYLPRVEDQQKALPFTVKGWPNTTWQVDSKFPRFLPVPSKVSRSSDLGDSIMTAIVMAPLEGRLIIFTDLGRLRVQECERVEALRTELSKCRAKVIEKGDTLQIFPFELYGAESETGVSLDSIPIALHGAEIETYNDHRMAMCFAILGLKIPGIKIKNPACVKKTFPNFFQKLAAAPPSGLGATILDARTGRPLAGEELFAD